MEPLPTRYFQRKIHSFLRRSILEATSIFKTKDKPIRTAVGNIEKLTALAIKTNPTRGTFRFFNWIWWYTIYSTCSEVLLFHRELIDISGPPQLPDIKPELLQQITDMGFPEARAKKALYLSK